MRWSIVKAMTFIVGVLESRDDWLLRSDKSCKFALRKPGLGTGVIDHLRNFEVDLGPGDTGFDGLAIPGHVFQNPQCILCLRHGYFLSSSK